MAILQTTNAAIGLIGVTPSVVYINTNDTAAGILASGYLNGIVQSGGLTVNNSTMALVNTTNGVVWCAVSITGNAPNLTYSLVVPTNEGGSVFTSTTSSATPGTIRSLVATMAGTATVMTSGNLVGVRGQLNVVGASGGFLYGTQGKVIATGALTGSSWTAGVFGQLDIHSATINGGQTATIWGDYGTTSGTITSATGMYGIAMTNTTAAVLNAQVYLYGGATSLFELATNPGLVGTTYVTAGGAGVIGGTIKKLAITIDNVVYYLVAGTTVT